MVGAVLAGLLLAGCSSDEEAGDPESTETASPSASAPAPAPTSTPALVSLRTSCSVLLGNDQDGVLWPMVTAFTGDFSQANLDAANDAIPAVREAAATAQPELAGQLDTMVAEVIGLAAAAAGGETYPTQRFKTAALEVTDLCGA